MNDRTVRIKDGQPVAQTKGAKKGWGTRESVVKPSIALQGQWCI